MGVKKLKGLKIINKKYESSGTAFNSWAMNKNSKIVLNSYDSLHNMWWTAFCKKLQLEDFFQALPGPNMCAL